MLRKLGLAVLFLIAAPVHAEYSFEVLNSTDEDIVSLEASEDGRNWGEFDIGYGIESGDSRTLVWSRATDNSGCEWYFRATFSDDTTSRPKLFDFCEDDLVLEFE